MLKKRIFAILLAVTMIATFMPTMAFADTTPQVKFSIQKPTKMELVSTAVSTSADGKVIGNFTEKGNQVKVELTANATCPRVRVVVSNADKLSGVQLFGQRYNHKAKMYVSWVDVVKAGWTFEDGTGFPVKSGTVASADMYPVVTTENFSLDLKALSGDSQVELGSTKIDWTTKAVVKTGTKTYLYEDVAAAVKEAANSNTDVVVKSGSIAKAEYTVGTNSSLTINNAIIATGTTFKLAKDAALVSKVKVDEPTASLSVTGYKVKKIYPAGYSYAWMHASETGTSIKDAKVEILGAQATSLQGKAQFYYTGQEIKPEVKVTLGGSTLKNNIDYTVSYSDNKLNGLATVTVTGIGNYSGSTSTTFQILQSDITDLITTAIADQQYTGSEVIPTLEIKLGETKLVQGTDFTVTKTTDSKQIPTGTVQDNINVSKDAQAATTTTAAVSRTRAYVTIAGKGGFIGSKTMEFKITPKSMVEQTKPATGDANVIISPILDQGYDGTAQTPVPTVTYKDKALVKDVDYTVTYSNNVNIGTANATITGKGNFTGSRTVNFKIVEKKDIATLTDITVASFTYTGKTATPKATIKDGTYTLVEGVDYTITSTNKSIGSRKATIKGLRIYGGTKTVSFKIIPKKVTIKTPSVGRRYVTVKWSKKSGITGYQAKISTKKDFSSGCKVATLKKAKYTSKTFYSLKKGKKYYTKVRAYKVVSGKRYYSNWSSVKLSAKVK